MSANIEFPGEAQGDIPVASDANRKRMFLDQGDGTMKLKDQAGVVVPITSQPVPWTHNPIVTNPPFSVGAPYTAAGQETVKVDPTGGAIRVNLPTAVGIPGVQIKIVSVTDAIGPPAITVFADGAETINGDPSRPILTPRERFTVESDGSNWIVTD